MFFLVCIYFKVVFILLNIIKGIMPYVFVHKTKQKYSA